MDSLDMRRIVYSAAEGEDGTGDDRHYSPAPHGGSPVQFK